MAIVICCEMSLKQRKFQLNIILLVRIIHVLYGKGHFKGFKPEMVFIHMG